MTWDNVKVMSVVVAAAFLLVILLAKPLEAYQLGETYAQNLGVNIRTLRILLVVLSSVLSACIVHLPDRSLCGDRCAAADP